MNLGRKIRRRRAREEEKKAIKKMSKQLEHMQNMPSNCTVCDAPFERTRETVDSWRVECDFETGNIRLLCPEHGPEEQQ